MWLDWPPGACNRLHELQRTMKQKLWALALLKTELDFFHGGIEGDGTLEAQGQGQTSRINLEIRPQSPMRGFLEFFPGNPVEEPVFH